MTQAEIQAKLDQAQEKVEKRKTTISKLIKKLDVTEDQVYNLYNQLVADNGNNDYLPSRVTRQAVDQVIPEKPERDEYDNWIDANYEYNSKISQLSDNLQKLYEVERVVKTWQLRLQKQANRENVEQIPILVEFLNRWEENCRDYYHNERDNYVRSANQFHEIVYKFLQDHNYSNLDYEQKKGLVNTFNSFMLESFDKRPRYRWGAYELSDWLSSFDSLTESLIHITFIKDDQTSRYDYDNFFGHEAQAGHYELKSYDDERLNKILHEEKIRKYAKLVEQVTAITGPITDVSDLHIDVRGDLNGIVVGENGKAKVNTIGAGGYNIQCFHYRCLVKPIRN